jgi:hypothetical protein
MTICSRVSAALGMGVGIGLLLIAPCAKAQQAEDQAAARALFDEARKLVKDGQVAEACPKFEAAAKLYSSAGILLNLGDCYEKTGRTASAWTEFSESAAAAERANRHDQAAEARKRQAALQPKLSRLTIVVHSQVAGLTISRDETDVAAAAWGTPIPVDSGAHRVRATAAGHDPWETSVTLSNPGQTIVVEVPELHETPVAVAPVASAVSAPEGGGAATGSVLVEPAPAQRPRTVAFVLLGAGVVVGVGGAVLMGVEAGRASSARSAEIAGNDATTYRTTTDEYNSTKLPYALGVAGAIAGGAAAVTGVVLLLTGHGGHAQSPAVGAAATPWSVPGGGGLSVGAPW